MWHIDLRAHRPGPERDDWARREAGDAGGADGQRETTGRSG